ncbi:uncharacterized protein E0L32_004056 [Thyridium curvatum]|uniref:SET domain-containing protein n=1 Tax=Thyridium curvatum TaxID=1093900 RepID=A0A507B984_9PEZI|nr:uncharacterized protein E0L32_004056 [Thyridium curvatum]TPX16407.1 hypothetical protein E0L32_004056 [Thyridium curvatum]
MASLCSMVLVCVSLVIALTASVTAKIEPAIRNDGIGLDKVQYAVNQSVLAGTHPIGWYSPKGLCSGHYCVHSNRQVASRRGIVVISMSKVREKIDSMKALLDKPSNNQDASPFPFDTIEDADNGLTLLAAKKVRRGTPLMNWTPVFLIHKDFFDDEPEAEQDRLLEAALQLLPDETRQKVNSYRQRPGGGMQSLREFVRSHPFEINLSSPFDKEQSEKHFATYPEASILTHDCRPNTAYFIGPELAAQFTVARKLEPGETVTVSVFDSMLPRAVRQELSHRVRGTNCSCSACIAGGNLMGVTKAEERLREIKSLEELLKDPRTSGVTVKMVDRYLSLYEQERLQSRMMEAYWTAAINYNNLGYEKRALKYVHLAIQAGIIEMGIESNDIVAMRIMAADPKGHYSWQQRLNGFNG